MAPPGPVAPPIPELPAVLVADGLDLGDVGNVVVTPEGVQLDQPVAGLPSRMLSRLIDTVVMLMLMTVLALPVAFIQQVVGGYAQVGMMLLVLFGYPMAFELIFRGRTLGKMIVGLRVVTAEGGPVRLRHVTIRAVMAIFEILGTFGTLAVLTAFFSSRSQRLGDMAAGTYVVHERTGERTTRAVVFPCPAGYEEFVARLDVSRVSERDYGVIRAFLLRSATLGQSARFALGADLGFQLVDLLGLPLPQGQNPETFLVCVCCAFQRREGGLSAVGWQEFESATYVPPESVVAAVRA